MGFKLYCEGIKKLPKKWVKDETVIQALWGDRLMAANEKYAPIIYEKGEWRELVLINAPKSYTKKLGIRFHKMKKGKK